MAKRYSKIANNYPSFQNESGLVLNGYSWLKSRELDDNAEGLWRLHDTLYDLKHFANVHPGGSDWINLTKGTDITEAFETHHLNSGEIQPLLKTYKVRDATLPRNFRFTFKTDGFYCTLKRKVAKKLKTIDRKPEFLSKLFIDLLLILSFISAIVTIRIQSILLLILSSLFLCWTVISAHNFFHRRDNFRMLYFNLTFLSYREWRIQHSLSHHLYPNSIHDLEVTMLESYMSWLPSRKGIIKRYGSWIYSPVFYSVIHVGQLVTRFALSIKNKSNLFYATDLIPYILPSAMYFFGNGASIVRVLIYWLLIIYIASFFFGIVGVNAGHHHPDIVHDGDELRENMDWGLYTMDTVFDNSDFSRNQFLALANFGHHVLHHLFPTLDHGILSQLYPILMETMLEFDVEFQTFPWWQHIYGQLRQLARTETMKEDAYIRFKKRTGKRDVNFN